jgi:DNA-binding GntR family transcriptional regulator
MRLLHGKMNGVQQEALDQHEKMVIAARKRDSDAMRILVKEHSNNLLNQITIMSKLYPQFFTNEIK